MRITSGGQTGADIAGLWAAKLFSIETSGWAPNHFVTLDGPKPEMAKTFGIKEFNAGYRGRTIANLKLSDATIVLSEKMSAGTKLTIDQCKKEHVPCFIKRLDPSNMNESVDTAIRNLKPLIDMIGFNEKTLGLPFVLNVAGNSTQNSARAFEFSFKVCYKLFTELGYTTEAGITEWCLYQDKWE